MSLAPAPPSTPLPYTSPFLLLFSPPPRPRLKAGHCLVRPHIRSRDSLHPPAHRLPHPDRSFLLASGPPSRDSTARPFSLARAPSRSASLPSAPAQTAGGATVAAALRVQPPTLEDTRGPGGSRASPAPAAPPRTRLGQAPRDAGSRRRLPRALLLPLSELPAGFLLRLQGCTSNEERKYLSPASKRSLGEPGSSVAVPDVFALALALRVRKEGRFVSFRLR